MQIEQAKKMSMQQLMQQLNPLQNPAVYNDDEEIKVDESDLNLQKLENLKYDLEQNLQLNVKKKNVLKNQKVFSVQKALKLSSTKTQTLSIQVSLKTGENLVNPDMQQLRPGVDLIVVIDQSGSMKGEKMFLVKQTLIYLLEILNERDRISLIEFETTATRILPLISNSQKNKQRILNTINGLNARGGTNICQGMSQAFKVLKERKFKNQVSSIFLLSDGIDPRLSAEVDGKQKNITTEKLIEEFHKFETQDPFSIHSFGFGNDHDADSMNDISKFKDGNFYYVEQLDQVDEMFVDALGGLFSVVAQDIDITVQVERKNKLFADTNILQTYGDFWKYNEQKNQYNIKLIQLYSGVSKDFLLEIEIPPILGKVNDFERNTVLLSATLEAVSVGDNKQPIARKADLELTIYNEDENIMPEINEEVQINVIRVRGAQAMDQAIKLADQGNYQQGQQLLQNFEGQIKSSSQHTQDKLVMLQQDIQMGSQACNQQQWGQQGKFYMVSNQRAHMDQRSRAYNQGEDMYQNIYQKQMVIERKTKKK